MYVWPPPRRCAATTSVRRLRRARAAHESMSMSGDARRALRALIEAAADSAEAADNEANAQSLPEEPLPPPPLPARPVPQMEDSSPPLDGLSEDDLYGDARSSRSSSGEEVVVSSAAPSPTDRPANVETPPFITADAAAAPRPATAPGYRTVLDLRPRPGVRLSESSSVAAGVKQLSAANVDAGLVIAADGQLRGILTSSDVARKLVAEARCRSCASNRRTRRLPDEALCVTPCCAAGSRRRCS